MGMITKQLFQVYIPKAYSSCANVLVSLVNSLVTPSLPQHLIAASVFFVFTHQSYKSCSSYCFTLYHTHSL